MLQVYNYMFEHAYIQKKELTGYTAKANELKKVYQNIINLSKQLPSYIINLSKENQTYTIGVKEGAMSLKAKVSELKDEKHPTYHSKRIDISEENKVRACLLNDDVDGIPEEIELSIQSLASEQVNQSNDLFHFARELGKGKYRFKLNILDEVYHLEFTLKEKTSNRDILYRMEEYLNENAPAIRTRVEKGSGADSSHLVINSEILGHKEGKTFTFENDERNEKNFVEFLGLNNVHKLPTNAEFEINGVKRYTSVNNFTIEKSMHMTLLQPTKGQPVYVKLHKDSDKFVESLQGVLNEYNGLIHLAMDRIDHNTEAFRAKRLMSELNSLVRHHKNELRDCGIHMEENGVLVIEEQESKKAADDGKIELLFKNERGFIAAIINKSDSIAIDPLNYLDKKIVTYPGDERKTFINPYRTSYYSGLFFSSYC